MRAKHVRSVADQTVEQLQELYDVINKGGGAVTATYVSEVLPFDGGERNRHTTVNRLNYFACLGFLTRVTAPPGTPYGADLYAVNPDKSDFLVTAYSLDQQIKNNLEDAIVETLAKHGPLDSKEIADLLPPMPCDRAGRALKKTQKGRVQVVCHELIARRVLGEGPLGFYVRGARR